MDACERHIKSGAKKPIGNLIIINTIFKGRILLKGETITLVQVAPQ